MHVLSDRSAVTPEVHNDDMRVVPLGTVRFPVNRSARLLETLWWGCGNGAHGVRIRCTVSP